MYKQELKFRLPLLLLAIISIFLGIWAGLHRIGWQWPLLFNSMPVNHGPLMISGFLGTLISLERAVAINRRWMYMGPLVSSLGALLLLFGLDRIIGSGLILLGSIIFVLISWEVLRIQLINYTIVMAAGGIAWLVGNVLWMSGRPIYQLVLWWAGFLVLTIAGERLELGRIIRISKLALRSFYLIIGFYVLGLIILIFDLDLGTRLASVGLLLLAFWLLRNDVARKTIRQQGLPRFIAVCLMGGYIWLGVSGILGLSFGAVTAGPNYDAFLHSLLLGFVMIMIFGHAPIIFPAVLGVPVVYNPTFYLHVGLLHLSLVIRLTGDLGNLPSVRMWGGLLNAVAILLFFLNTGRAVRAGIIKKS